MRIATVAALALALLAVPASGALAKKKSGGTKPFEASIAPNAAVPEATGGAVRSTPLLSTISVPKKYKGKVVGDLNVTGLQTTGSVTGAANDLAGYLTAPNGRTFQLFWTVGDQNIGPWTIDDDTGTSICNQPAAAPCANATQALNQPFAGTSNALYNWAGGFPVNGTLTIFNGLKMNGTWTLLVTDYQPAGVGNGTSVLNRWGLKITPAKPVAK